ncbi:hypothetical protein [Streptosporangium sp. OZ121]|uniref:hypothetical protein n=1 Tax=Streptosporangium sp. OZ121 TaxID=3444183 RepID=UPI003F7A73D9
MTRGGRPTGLAHIGSVYVAMMRELPRRNKAYPCFATRDELAANVAAQRAAKVLGAEEVVRRLRR